MLPILEEAFEADEVTEEEVLGGIFTIGRVLYDMRDNLGLGLEDECLACYKRAREGYERVLGVDSEKRWVPAVARDELVVTSNSLLVACHSLYVAFYNCSFSLTLRRRPNISSLSWRGRRGCLAQQANVRAGGRPRRRLGSNGQLQGCQSNPKRVALVAYPLSISRTCSSRTRLRCVIIVSGEEHKERSGELEELKILFVSHRLVIKFQGR